MLLRLKEVLENRHDNYIFPFFWQHGESEDKLREYMEAIETAGIKAVCLESRPHPDFAGDGWWRDLDIILDEAKKRDMKVWILDDAHFPSGQAAGKMKDADTELRKQYIMIKYSDLCGPMPQVTVPVGKMAATKPNPLTAMQGNSYFAEKDKKWFDDDRLLAAVACKMSEDDWLDDSFLDLTEMVEDGVLEWNVPDGMWRVCVLYETRNGGGRTDYVNMLDKNSCRVQIDAVYEPHFKRYKEEFGKTIAGFFSDEPCIGNTIGFDFNESIGKRLMPLPWSKAMPEIMKANIGEDYLKKLVALWMNVGSKNFTAKIRFEYMNAVTALTSENFSGQIGKWCEDHGVEYVGHIVEDNSQHCRLGSSQGHFFRSMRGQHMAGIDDIGNQVIPGGDYFKRIRLLGGAGDGEFFHFELGKLGSSLAHIDPLKKGRAMCEIFGAYGWSAGTRLMKYLTDHFLVRGINHFVPHAFSPKKFPDPDCPPHFYADGEDALYRHFGQLMKYMNRVCHLFNGGMHIATVALLYHAEAEWTGECMFDQKPARVMLENQIDFDIIPQDVFGEKEYYKTHFDGKLNINGESYEALVIPYAEFITESTAQFVLDASTYGFPVIFVGGFPIGICDSKNEERSSSIIQNLKSYGAVSVELHNLAQHLSLAKLNEISIDPPFKKLRYYHYKTADADLFMFSNEDMGKTYEGAVTVAAKGKASFYDAMKNRLYRADCEQLSSGTVLNLKLAPYESIIVVFDNHFSTEEKIKDIRVREFALEGEWKISVAEAKKYPNFKEIALTDKLVNIGRIFPDFSGFICYEKEFDYPYEVTGNEVLQIEDAFDGVEVFLNGENLGISICPPYYFELRKILKRGTNQIRIEVATTLFRKVRSMEHSGLFAMFADLAASEPIGIIGNVVICDMK